MPLEAFDWVCPDIARAETQVCTVPAPGLPGVPPGNYVLREFYCTEPECDCRRLLVQFLPLRGRTKIAASINYGWEKPSFYEGWSGDARMSREMARATLEPLAEQGPHARPFLQLFEQAIKNPAVVERFRGHYRMVKAALKSAPARGASVPAQAIRRAH